MTEPDSPDAGVDVPLTHDTVETNGVSLHVVRAGPTDGDPVVLLHGFPEFWYGWRHQIPALVDAGYRVVAPDQRGYNRSEKPDGLDAYTADTLGADAVGLLDAFGHDEARFVGHDWGAAVLWDVLLRSPDRVTQAVTMNVPHPAAFAEYMGTASQLRKSWYMFAYQLPRVPEAALRFDGWSGMRWFIDTSNREDTFTESDLDRYREAWARPGAVTAMLDWYRALVRRDVPDPPSWTVTPPTMVVWGLQDPYLRREMAPASVDQCADGRLEEIEDATHWVHHERSARVNDLLTDFFG